MTFRRDQAELLVVLGADAPGDRLAIARGEYDRFEALGDLTVGGDDRFEQVLAILPAADARELGPDLAAERLAVPHRDLVTAEAAHLGLRQKDLPASADVAAGQGLAVGG